MKKKIFALAILSSINSLYAQTPITNDKPSEKKWFDKMSIRGYAQVRYNGLLQTNEDLECEQCDKSWGGEGEVKEVFLFDGCELFSLVKFIHAYTFMCNQILQVPLLPLRFTPLNSEMRILMWG